MNITTAKHKIAHREINSAEIMQNPTNRNEWFITLYSALGRPFILVDESDSAITSEHIPTLLGTLKELGLRSATINF